MSKKNTTLSAVTVSSSISQSLYDKVVSAFKSRPIKDTDTLIAVGRQAGRQEVLDFLYKHITEGYVSGDQRDIDIKTQEYKPSQRLFRGVLPNRDV